MARLTVVFEYDSTEGMREAAKAFQKGNIANLVDVAEYDAVAAHDSLHERFLGDKKDSGDGDGVNSGT